jgi:type I restriction enzyme R subunit
MHKQGKSANTLYMQNSNFRFLTAEYPNLARLGMLAEKNVFDDPSNSLIKLRIFSEKIALNIGDFEGMIEFDKISQFERLRQLEDEDIISGDITEAFHKIRKSGNKSAHSGNNTSPEARFMLRQAFRLAKWFYEVYEGEDLSIDFVMPDPNTTNHQQLKQLQDELKQSKEELEALRAKIATMQALPAPQKAARKARGKQLSRMNETEAETRERIDQQLRDAGWECDTESLNYKKHKTLPAKGKKMAIAEWKCGTRWADYALFIGYELVGIVEAKKHSKNAPSALEQAKIYSQQVLAENNAQFVNHANHLRYKVPFMFGTNGRPYLEQFKTESGIWYWDGRNQKNPAKALTAWLSPDNLKEKLAFDASQGAQKLQNTPYDLLTHPNGLNLRSYQVEAIKAVEHKVLTNLQEQRALLAMATGTGKTRTMIGLCYRLIASGRFRRILFLVDRRMLGTQAQDAFKEVKIEGLQTFAQIYDLQELEKPAAELDTKIHFATIQSMVQRISSDQPPSVGDYDCIVVDEAHRGYTLDKDLDDEELLLRSQDEFQSKYRMVLDYFDAYRIGLTATPAVHTEAIFGNRVYTYSYSQAVIDGYLIDFEPPVVCQTRLATEGIVWEKGAMVKVYDPEDTQIKEMGTTEDEIKVEIEGFNRHVINESFNQVVLRELIKQFRLDPDDKKKTLIFAATDKHADMIVKVLYEEYAEEGLQPDADAIVKITGSVHNRVDLLKRFKNEQYPSIVVTVDLLTTGVDVPAICNLVFLRRVKSRILYDQMMGRATRRCDDIGKEVFRVFDAVGVTRVMAEAQVMKPVAPAVAKTFAHLSEEIGLLQDEEQQQNKLTRVLAKRQRKLRNFDHEQMAHFESLSGETTARDFATKLQNTAPDQLAKVFEEYESLWEFLDRAKGNNQGYGGILFSEHQDEVQEVSYAYSKNLKPKDYLEAFADFVNNRQNELAALKVICTKPASLTRRDLKELKLELGRNGYSKRQLNKAYGEVNNQEVVADIIAHIRTAALGTSLVAHEERIKNAVAKLKASKDWSLGQLKWLDKIESQLLQESVITIEDLDRPPFKNDGGIKRIDKLFKGETQKILDDLNGYLYA